MPPPTAKRGRPADYCGRPCRQAAYRERQRLRGDTDPVETAPRTLPGQTPEQLQVMELAHDTQEELRHLVRLLSNSQNASAAEILEYSVRVQRRMEAVTAGVVLMARRRRIPWEALGQILNISPETARHSYHERLVQRRLDQYAPTHLATPPPSPDPAPDDGDADGEPAPAQPPARPSLRAANQLAPILSKLQVASGIPLRQLGLRTQVSASYLSRVLSGEKFPTWDLTARIARVLGADSDAVHKVWLDERDRNGTRTRQPQPQAPETDLGATLPAALRTLHQHAACPTPYSLEVATGHLVTADDIRKILHGEMHGTWDQVEALIRAMDGEPSFFQPHWEESQQATPTPPSRPAETTTHRLDRLLSTFGGAFNDTRTLETSPSIAVRRRALRRRLQHAARTST
ncbi:helix-turn-helix domain-containing protein [Streptomyces sp. NBC_00140]|uniref:helix-turn-helix domain-containing protein n=1 Tax=Streptomyces sp. NBC_00140 TaxID=2975664 RepID=UPI0022581DB8|nr:helix-turn-helix transcriptional regulator [Streptomyces sp. NBC_00140]MCX5327857.1 helix-turn-helix transcriptional regulator [Streptomyces sp. NBC_00140]